MALASATMERTTLDFTDDRLGENGLRAPAVALPKTFTQPPCLNSSVKFFQENRFLANAPHQEGPLFAGLVSSIRLSAGPPLLP